MTTVSILKQKIKAFFVDNKALVNEISEKNTEIFEAYCFAAIAQFYLDKGYKLQAKQADDGYFTFRFAPSTYPWNHSYFEVLDPFGAIQCEIRHNLSVAGYWAYHPSKAYDQNIVEDFVPQFQADIAIVMPGLLPSKRANSSRLRRCLPNSALISFAEVKHMKAAPMLLASFQGMVYMIKSPFVVNRWYRRNKQIPHPVPTLFVIGNLSANAQSVVKAMKLRLKAQINIISKGTDLSIATLASELSK